MWEKSLMQEKSLKNCPQHSLFLQTMKGRFWISQGSILAKG